MSKDPRTMTYHYICPHCRKMDKQTGSRGMVCQCGAEMWDEGDRSRFLSVATDPHGATAVWIDDKDALSVEHTHMVGIAIDGSVLPIFYSRDDSYEAVDSGTVSNLVCVCQGNVSLEEVNNDHKDAVDAWLSARDRAREGD